ncbi:MAG: cupin domain-containing protein [Pseudomonadota bacterium]
MTSIPRSFCVLAMVLAATLTSLPAPVAADGIERQELRRTPVPGAPDLEVVVMRLTVPVGATLPMHTHAGDEHAVVITPAKAETPRGYMVEFQVGQTLYFPEGQPHGGLKNVGDGPMIAITTSIVNKGAPFSSPLN